MAKSKISVIFIFIVLLITTILNSGSVYLTVESYFPMVFLILAFLVVSWQSLNELFRTQKIEKTTLFVTLYLVFIWVNTLINYDLLNIKMASRYTLILVVSYFISHKITMRQFAKIFTQTINYLSVFALIHYTFFVLLDVKFNFTYYLNSNNIIYAKSLFSFHMVHDKWRLTSIFWEPGMYASMIVYSLLFDQIYDHNSRKASIYVRLVSLILTRSTSAYLLYLAIMFLRINKVSDGKKNKYISNIFIIIAIIMMVLFYSPIIDYLNHIWPTIFSKVANKTGSFTTRLYSPLLDLSIYAKSPIIGVGYSDYARLWNINSANFDVLSQTSTITYLIAVFGMPPIIFYVFLIIGISSFKHVNLINRVIITTVLTVILSKEPHQFSIVTTTICFYFLKCNFMPTTLYKTI